MATKLSPAFAYTVVYVKDVAKSDAFYANAFGYSVRRLDDSHKWGELERTDHYSLHAGPSTGHRPVGIVIALGEQRAVENGAVPVSEPEEKNWGQKVGYVKDPDGIVVRLGSHVVPSKSQS